MDEINCEKRNANYLFKDYFKECKTKEYLEDNISMDELKEALELEYFDTDNLFDESIKDKGERYFIQCNVREIVQNGDTYNSIVRGSKNYNVSITFEDKEETKIKKMTCDCPYFVKEHKNCKHMYATLYAMKCYHNFFKIFNEITAFSNASNNMLNDFTNFIHNNQKSINLVKAEIFNNNVLKLKDFINNDMKPVLIERVCSEKQLLLLLLKYINDTINLRQEFIDLKSPDYLIENTYTDEQNLVSNEVSYNTSKQESSNISANVNSKRDFINKIRNAIVIILAIFPLFPFIYWVIKMALEDTIKGVLTLLWILFYAFIIVPIYFAIIYPIAKAIKPDKDDDEQN